MFRGPLAGDDLEVFLERINWHNRPPEIRWLEDGAGVLEWTRLKAPVHVDKYVPPPPPPIVEKPADFAFDPNFVPPDDAFDEDSYSRYFTEDD